MCHHFRPFVRGILSGIIALLFGVFGSLLVGCGGGAEQNASTGGDKTASEIASGYRNNLSTMEKTRIDVKGHPFEVWVARTSAEQQLGLMRVTQDQLSTLPDGVERGMLFIFSSEQMLAFWMLNTIIPLDIVYIRGDGQIVRKYTMAPQETRLYPSVEPAQYALEMRAGLLQQLNIGPGDHVEIPRGVLKATP